MKSLIGEYGGVVIMVLTTLTGLILFATLLNGNDNTHGIITTYNTNMLYENDLYKNADLNANSDAFDDANGVTGIYSQTNLHKPYFYLSGAVESDYLIEVPSDNGGDNHTTIYSYEDVLDLFSVNDKLKVCVWNDTTKSYDTKDLKNSDVEIVITKYIPAGSDINGGALNNPAITEDIGAVDKFGNPIIEDGNQVIIKQIKYNEEVYTKSSAEQFYINWDVSCRYKVIYRISDDSLKAEYTAMFLNKIRDAESVFTEVYENWESSRETPNPGE